MFISPFAILLALASSIGALYCNNRKFAVKIESSVSSVDIHNDFTNAFRVSGQNVSSSLNPHNSFPEEITFKMNESCKRINDTYWICPSLEKAFSNLQLTNTCFVVSDININTPLSIVNVTGFTLMGDATLKCTGNFGITVINSLDIVFSSITFIGCGQNHSIRSYTVEERRLLLTSALYFENVTLFSFENINLQYSLGYSLILLNPGPGNIINCNFQYSKCQIYETSLGNCSYGGGLIIDYYGSNSKEVEEVLFRDTYIQNNPHPYEECKISDCVYTLSHDLPITNGGGISMHFRKGTTLKKVTVAGSTNIMINKARCGGGVYIRMEEESQNNTVVFNNTYINDNTAYLSSGGGVQINNFGVNNTFEFVNTQVHSNIATSGGGIYVRLENNSHSSVVNFKNTIIQNNIATLSGGGIQLINNSKSKSLIQISDSQIVENQANIGSNMMIKSASVNLESVKINNGDTKDIKNEIIGQGAVYVVNGELNFTGRNFFCDNKLSAVILDFSNVVIEGELTFQRNSGRTGGALLLQGRSTVVLKNNSKLDFDSNQAEKIGGAMYVLVPGPTMRLWLPSSNKKYCFFQLDDFITTQVTFVNNSAYELKDNDIFVSTLNVCRSSFEESAFDILSSWKGFNFIKQPNSIVTNAVDIMVDLTSPQVKQPGKISNIALFLKDERNQLVDEKVIIKIGEIFMREFFVKNSTVNITLYGPVNTKLSVVITTVSVSKTVEMTLKNCSYGYKFDDSKKSCVCNCDECPFCNEDFIQFPENKWIYNHSIYPCPYNLCRKYSSNSDNSYFDESNQCVEGRNQASILCSECLPNYSVSLRDSSCINCKGKPKISLVSLLLVIFGVGMVLNILVIALNIKDYAWYLLPTTFFYVTIKQIFVVKEYTPECWKWVVDIISLLFMQISFELFPSWCFMENMTDFIKFCLHYAVAIIWLISFVVVALATVNFAKLKREVIKRSFPIVSSVIYWKIFHVLLQLMLSIQIDGEKQKRLWISPKQFYFDFASKQHESDFITAAFLMIVSSALILCLSLYFIIKKDYSYYYCEGLKKKFRWTCVFYHVCQVIITVLVEVGSNKGLDLMEMWKAVTILFLFSFLLMVKPFEETRRNVFHIVLLTTLLLLASINNSLESMSSHPQKIYSDISLILVMFPMIYCMFEAARNYFKTGKNQGKSAQNDF